MIIKSIVLFSYDSEFIEAFKSLQLFKCNTLYRVTAISSGYNDLYNYIITYGCDYLFIDQTEPLSKYANGIGELLQNNTKLRIVPLSNCKNFEAAVEAIHIGAYDFLVKPITSEQIESILSRDASINSQSSTTPHFSDTFLSDTGFNALISLMFNHDDMFINKVEQLYIRGEMDRSVKLVDLQQNFYRLLCQLLDNAKAKYPFIYLYIPQENKEHIILEATPTSDVLKKTILTEYRDLFDVLKIFDIQTTSGLIKDVNLYVLENVENNLTLEKIAQHFFVNKTYLSHLFKTSTGTTFVKHFTTIRMLRSRVLLLERKKIYECAQLLNYEDTEYFSKTFRKFYGIRPTEYSQLNYNQPLHIIS